MVEQVLTFRLFPWTLAIRSLTPLTEIVKSQPWDAAFVSGGWVINQWNVQLERGVKHE